MGRFNGYYDLPYLQIVVCIYNVWSVSSLRHNQKGSYLCVCASVSTLAALLLDILVFRRTVSRGKYKQMVDEKPAGIAAPYNAPEYSDSRGSIQLQQYTTPTSQHPDRAGYEVPEEQFNYDTSYHGGHEPDTAPR